MFTRKEQEALAPKFRRLVPYLVQPLERWKEEDLRRVANALKGVNRMSPNLYSAKQKVKAVLPAPVEWPKVVRQLPLRKEEFAFEGPNGMILRLNNRGLLSDLNKTHTWGDGGPSQMPLFIIGPLDTIYAAIEKATGFRLENQMSSNNPGAVYIEDARKHGVKLHPRDTETVAHFEHASANMPLWVGCEPISRLTDEAGVVLHDAATELVQAAGGAIAGFAGGFASVGPEIIDILKTVLDTIGLIELTNMEPGEIFNLARDRIRKSGRTGNKVVTITIGLTGDGAAINTGLSKLSHEQSLAAIRAAVAVSLARGKGW